MVRRVIAGTPQPLAGVPPITRCCWQWRDSIASNRDLRPIRFTFTVDRPLWLIKNRLNPERSPLSALGDNDHCWGLDILFGPLSLLLLTSDSWASKLDMG